MWRVADKRLDRDFTLQWAKAMICVPWRSVAQLVERWSPKPVVGGSSPPAPARNHIIKEGLKAFFYVSRTTAPIIRGKGAGLPLDHRQSVILLLIDLYAVAVAIDDQDPALIVYDKRFRMMQASLRP